MDLESTNELTDEGIKVIQKTNGIIAFITLLIPWGVNLPAIISVNIIMACIRWFLKQLGVKHVKNKRLRFILWNIITIIVSFISSWGWLLWFFKSWWPETFNQAVTFILTVPITYLLSLGLYYITKKLQVGEKFMLLCELLLNKFIKKQKEKK